MKGEEMSEVCPVCATPVPAGAATCSTCGFKFAGATQSFSPFTIENGEVVSAEASAPSEATLTVVRGPQTGTVFTLKRAPLTVGRNPSCDIFLNDMTVSRMHATILPVDGGFTISDEHSFNGVWVDGKSVDSAPLVAGCIIQVGAFCLLYQEDSAQ